MHRERSFLIRSEILLIPLAGLIAQLLNASVDGERPMAHPHEVAATLRPDRVSESDRLAALESIAPEMAAGLFLVPKVIA